MKGLDGSPKLPFSYLPWGIWDAGMAYVVRAIHRDGVTRTVKIEKNTLREAKESAKSLRELGLWVIIIGPDGKTLDETKEDP